MGDLQKTVEDKIKCISCGVVLTPKEIQDIIKNGWVKNCDKCAEYERRKESDFLSR